jgi:hypothetical protein
MQGKPNHKAGATHPCSRSPMDGVSGFRSCERRSDSARRRVGRSLFRWCPRGLAVCLAESPSPRASAIWVCDGSNNIGRASPRESDSNSGRYSFSDPVPSPRESTALMPRPTSEVVCALLNRRHLVKASNLTIDFAPCCKVCLRESGTYYAGCVRTRSCALPRESCAQHGSPTRRTTRNPKRSSDS